MSLQDSYYDFISKTPLKGLAMSIENAGIPSFPVFILLLVLIVGAIGFFAYSSLQSSRGFYSVRVLSDSGAPVSGALVSVTYQGNVFTNYTDDNGEAVFPGVPSNALASLTVNATGFAVYSKQNVPSSYSAKLAATPASVTLNVESTGSAPIANANVLYQVNTGSIQTTVTDTNGNAVLTVPLNSQVSGTVTASGYQTGNFSFTASQQSMTENVVLNAVVTTTNPSALMQDSQNQNTIPSPVVPNASDSNIDANNNFSNNASVWVSVSDLNGNPLNASVSLFLNSSSQPFSTILASNGTAVFSASVGSSVYATASLNGYASTSSDASVVSAGGANLTLVLTPLNYLNTTNVTVSVFANSSNGTTPVSGSVYLWAYPSQNVVYESSVYESSAVISVPVGTVFRVGVYASGYVAQVSPLEFALNNSPLSVNFTLVNATLQNSFTLNVSTVDFYNNPVPGSYVSVYDNGVAFPLDVQNYQTDFTGNISIPGLPLPVKGFSVSAFSGAYSGKTVLNVNSLVNGTVSATVVLLPPLTSVKVEAYSFDGVPLNASFSSYFIDLNNQPHLIDTCSSQAPSTCSLKVFTGVSLVLQASSSNYLSTVYSSQFNPIDKYFQNFTLYPANSPMLENFQVLGPCGWNDSYTSCSQNSNAQLFNASTGNLIVGGKYYAVFNLNVNPASDHYGVYLLLGNSTSNSVLSDNAAIMKFSNDVITYQKTSGSVFNPLNFNVTGDTSFSGTCGSTIPASENGFLKWVEATGLTPPVGGVVTVEVPFMVTAPSPEGLNVYYRAFQISNNSYLRDPFDSRLNTSASTPGVSECSAMVYSQRFHVTQDPNSETLCSDQACLNVYCELNGDPNTKARCYNLNVPAAVTGNYVSVFYSVLDMNPDTFAGTTLTVGSPTSFDPNYLILNSSSSFKPVGSGYVWPNNSVTQTLYNNTGSGILTLGNVGNQTSTQPITFTYGQKLIFSTNVSLMSAPQPVSLAPRLPPYYIINYNSTYNNLTLSFGGKTVKNIQFLVDPIMPADAVFLVLNQSSVQCGNGLQFGLTNLSDQCITENTLSDDPMLSGLTEYFGSMANETWVLRYDPTNPKCSSYSFNPNIVNNFSGNAISVSDLCPLLNETFSINATADQVCNSTSNIASPYCAVTVKPSWDEQAMSVSGSNLGSPSSNYNTIYALINNQQYSQNGVASLHDQNNNPYSNPQLKSSQLTIPNNGGVLMLSNLSSKIIPPNISSVTNNCNSIDASNPSNCGLEPYFDAQCNPNIVGDGNCIPQTNYYNLVDLASVSSTAVLNNVLNVFENTVWRRGLFGSNIPSQLNSFPLSAFEDVNKNNVSYTVGVDWLGKVGGGFVDFNYVGINATKTSCTTQNQRGVYQLQITTNASGGLPISIQAQPAIFNYQGYLAKFQNNLNTPMCGTMTFNPVTNNFENTGDGWYYDAYPGVSSSLSDGQHSFTVNLIHPAFTTNGFWTRYGEALGNTLISCTAAVGSAYLACELAYHHPSTSALATTTFIGSFAYSYTFIENSLNNIIPQPTDAGDVYQIASMNGWLGKVCQWNGYLGTLSSGVSAYMRSSAAPNNAAWFTGLFDNSEGDPCAALAKQTFNSNCLCIGTSAGCIIGDVWKGLVRDAAGSSAAPSPSASIASPLKVKTPAQSQQASTPAPAQSQQASTPAPAQSQQASTPAPAQSQQASTPPQTDAPRWLTSTTNIVNGVTTAVSYVCDVPLDFEALANILYAANSQNVPAYIGIGINGNPSDSTLSFLNGMFTQASGNVDCANWQNFFDASQTSFVWRNFDLTSLHAFKNTLQKCYKAPQIQVYTSEADAISQVGTFYIFSQGGK